MNLNNIKHIHMIGIGGIGMSGLARILTDRGLKITGSDLKNNRLIEKLRKRGCNIRIGHGKIYGTPEAVVRSFSIKDNNPEIIQAGIRNIPVLERSELLKILFESKARSVAVTGTHGKTTTTAMISCIFDKAGLDPTVLIGGELDYFDGNARSGKGDILVSEVDESDGYLPKISSQHAIITNIEKEHLEYYKDMRNLLEAFKGFIHKRRNGVIFYNKDDSNLRRLTDGYKGKRISFGSSGNCDFYPMSIKENGLSQEFICFKKKKKLGNVYINIPGRHNVFNALAAISCGLEFGLEFDKMRDILSTFKGVKRRFEIKARVNDIILVEDYAHHPTEIKAVIGIASKLNRKRVIVIFQPHRFTRTAYLEKEFSKAFNDADELILTDIYAAGEDPIQGVSINNIHNGVKKEGSKSVKTLPKDEIAPYLKKIVRSGDIILVLGAGDINGIIPDIKKFLKRKI